MTAPCPDSLTHAAAIGAGFSHLLFMILSDCAAFSGEESWPLHTGTGMKSFCLFRSVFQHFSLQTASLLYEYQVTSVLGWLPTQLHLGSVARNLQLIVCTRTSACKASLQKCSGASALLVDGH